MSKEIKAKKKFFCQTCEHTDKYQTLPKEESGRKTSAVEFQVLLETGEI